MADAYDGAWSLDKSLFADCCRQLMDDGRRGGLGSLADRMGLPKDLRDLSDEQAILISRRFIREAMTETMVEGATKHSLN